MRACACSQDTRYLYVCSQDTRYQYVCSQDTRYLCVCSQDTRYLYVCSQDTRYLCVCSQDTRYRLYLYVAVGGAEGGKRASWCRKGRRGVSVTSWGAGARLQPRCALCKLTCVALAACALAGWLAGWLQSREAHAEMVEGLLLEARLRTRIAELREYRRNGIRTAADAEVGRPAASHRCLSGLCGLLRAW
jgi:hypothetical protein